MTSVVAIQALIFQDGGLLALGANIFNMAIVGVAVSYMAYRTVQKLAGGHRWGIYVGGFIAAWLSIEVVALSVALQLAFSGTSPANIAVLAMGGIHAIIGIGEGLITVGALTFIFATRPDFIEAGKEKPIRGAAVWLTGLLLAFGLAIGSPLASANPDGLEWVAARGGFLQAARAPLYKLIPDYLLPGISNQALATVLAGVVGVLIVLIVASTIAYTQRSHQTSKSRSE
jgi:cobalt/nickel transport system permease protein